jgi:hypothetical protein
MVSFQCRLEHPFTRGEDAVAKKKTKAAAEGARPQRRKPSAAESLQRMREFDKRKEAFIAALRKSKDRGLPP